MKRYITLILCLLFAMYAAAQRGGGDGIVLAYGTDGAITLRYECGWDGSLDNANGYVMPVVQGMAVVAQKGMPALPTDSRLIILPHGSTLRLVSWYGSDSLEVDLNGQMLMPAFGATLKDAEPEQTPEVDKEAYGVSGEYRDGSPVRVDRLGTMGNSEVYRVTVSPFHYRPLADTLGCQRMLEATLEATVAPLVSTSSPKRYLVVSRPEFREGLQPFLQWKRQEGYDVDEVYVETNKRDSAYVQIAPFFASSDANEWPRYILLVGDVEKIQSYVGGTSRPEGLSAHITDLYFAEHTGDYLPDALVGRWPVNDTAELNAVVRKTINYEQGIILDSAMLHRVLLVAGRETSSIAPTTTNGQVTYVARELVSSHQDVDTVCFYNPSSGDMLPEVLDEIQQGAAFVNYTAHCTTAGWQSPNLRLASIDTLDGARPLFYVNNCCKSNDFSGTGFGEQLLRKADGGAVAVIGATNSTLWNEDYYWAVGPKYPFSLEPQFDSLRLGAFDHWIGRVGDIHTAGELLLAGNLAVSAFGSPYDRFYWEIYCLLGDPALRPYLGVQQQAAVAVVGNPTAGCDSIMLQATAGATVSVVQDSMLLAMAVVPASGIVTLPLRQSLSAEAVIVTASGTGYLPAIDTLLMAMPQHGIGVYDITTSDSSVTFRVTNIGIDTVWGITALLTQDAGDIADGAHLAPASEAIDTLAPQASALLELACTPLAVGPRPRWHATLVVTDSVDVHAFAVEHSMAVSYPTLSVDLKHADGSFAAMLESGSTYRVVAAVAGVYDSLHVDVRALPDEMPMDAIFTAPDSIGHLYIGTDLYWGNWSSHTDRYIVVGQDYESFEHGLECHPWRMGGTQPWTLDSTYSHSGRYSLRSGAIAGRQTSDIEIDLLLPHADTLSFWTLPSTEPNYDRLLFYIDGRQRYENWGEGTWSQKVFVLGAGRHTLRWRYIKDESTNRGSDCVWLDDIRLPMTLWEQPYGCGEDGSNLGVSTASYDEQPSRIYPNPATDRLTVECRGVERVTVMDLFGRAMLESVTDASAGMATVDTRNLSAGIYIVVLHSANHQEHHKLIIHR